MIAGVALLVLLGVLAGFQLALAAGAPLGRFAWGGQHRVLPARLRAGSLAAVAIYVIIAVLTLDRAGGIDVVPDVVSVVGMWAVVVFFVLGIGLNAVSRSRPERFTMVPVTVALAALSLLVAVTGTG